MQQHKGLCVVTVVMVHHSGVHSRAPTPLHGMARLPSPAHIHSFRPGELRPVLDPLSLRWQRGQDFAMAAIIAKAGRSATIDAPLMPLDEDLSDDEDEYEVWRVCWSRLGLRAGWRFFGCHPNRFGLPGIPFSPKAR